ncbi:MAG: OmpA family protein [Candidatus Omnitrophota bacterium]
MKREAKFLRILFILILGITLSSCTFIFQAGRRSDVEKIGSLSSQLDELSAAKRLLEQRFKQEIADKQVRLEMADRGLIVTVVNEVLFDSGKAKLKSSAIPILDKVADILNENVADMAIGVEGHTDNVPIKVSGWKSNWELSAARAMSVLHYLVDEKKVNPKRISATGYGEYKPVASNDTREGRQLNRRVEIVILPKISKGTTVREKAVPKESKENLK